MLAIRVFLAYPTSLIRVVSHDSCCGYTEKHTLRICLERNNSRTLDVCKRRGRLGRIHTSRHDIPTNCDERQTLTASVDVAPLAPSVPSRVLRSHAPGARARSARTDRWGMNGGGTCACVRALARDSSNSSRSFFSNYLFHFKSYPVYLNVIYCN